MTPKSIDEKTVREIRRKTRRMYSVEDKIRIIMKSKHQSLTRFFISTTALFLFFLIFLGCIERGSEDTYNKAIEKSSDYIKELLERSEIPGISVAVAINDSVVWNRGFGYANVETKTPVTPKTMFRIGSISKVLTAGALGLLHEQGKLDLDAPVQKYVPEFPEKQFIVTTRQIAGHLSGIRDYKIDEQEDKRHYEDVITALELFKGDSLEYPPGDRYSYSSYGWNLISAIIQRSSGQPFIEYMSKNIFTPLGMNNTTPDDITLDIPNRSIFYTSSEEVAPTFDISYKWASGGLLSTAEDLVQYGSSFLPGSNFLNPQTKELLFTNQKTNDGREIIHGLGWIVQKFENNKPIYYHPGSMIGCQAILVVQPNDHIVIAILANRSGGFGELTANQIACFFLGLGEKECPEIEGARKLRIEKNERFQILNAAITAWKLALEEGDLEKLNATLSENIRSKEWKDKRTIIDYFQKVFSSGRTILTHENLHLRFQSRGYPIGTITYVEGITSTGALGTFSVRLTFIREESETLITNIELLQP